MKFISNTASIHSITRCFMPIRITGNSPSWQKARCIIFSTEKRKHFSKSTLRKTTNLQPKKTTKKGDEINRLPTNLLHGKQRKGFLFLRKKPSFQPNKKRIKSTSNQAYFKKLTAFPISSLTLPNRVDFYPKNRPFLHFFCIFARKLREKCEKTIPIISHIFFIFSSVSSSANFK